MRKLLLLFAALLTATVMNLQAENVYFKVTSATSWWPNDGAKIGAYFKVGTDPLDFGMYAQFFTLVPGTTDTYVGTVPENEEPFVCVQFLRYNSAATDPEEMNYWNATGVMTWDGVNDMFTATGSGDTWDSTTGTWSKFVPAPAANIYLDCESFDADNNWNQAGAKMGAMFTDGTTQQYTDFMSYDNTKKLFYASIPAGEWTSCIFIRHSNTATQTGWADFWNRSCEVIYDGSDNLYTIADWDGCTDTRDAGNHSDGEWSSISESEPDMHDFLYFVGLNGNDTVRLNKVADQEKFLSKLTATFEYSKDRKTWTPYDTWATSADPANTYQGDPIALAEGDSIFFRALGANKDGKNDTLSADMHACFIFAFGKDDSIAAGGNIMSLYDATCEQDSMTMGGFCKLFCDATQMVSAPTFPAKKMKDFCYQSTFLGCTSLTAAPELPSTTLEVGCYNNMFCNCTSLIAAPALPASQLSSYCYYSMFNGCISLTQAPELKPAELIDNCFNRMFKNCTSLEVDTCLNDDECTGALLVVPKMNAANWSKEMFTGCKGDAKYTAQYGIRPGGHYCMKEFIPDTIKDIELVAVNTVYDGQNHYITVTGFIEGDAVTYSTDSATWKQDTIYQKNACDTTIFVRIQRTDHIDWNGKSNIAITPRDITLQSASLEKKYDGKALVAYSKQGGTTVTVVDGSYVEGECLNYSYTGSQLGVGEGGNSFDVSDSKTALAANYNVTKQFGKLAVIKTDTLITITANSANRFYDGTPLTKDEYTVSGELGYKDSLKTVVIIGTITQVGSVPNEVTGYKILNKDGKDVTEYYSNIQLVNGTLTISDTASTCAEANVVPEDILISMAPVTVAYVNGAYTYIQDSTGGSLIYADNYGLKAGDKVTGFIGVSHPLEGGMPSIQPNKTVKELTIVAGAEPEPKLRTATPTINEIHQYVRYENVKIDSALLTPATPVEATLNNGDKIVLNSKFGSSYMMEGGEDITYDIVAIVGVQDEVMQLYPIVISVHTTVNLNDVNADNRVIEKYVLNGQLYIRVNGVLYNASGIRVE